MRTIHQTMSSETANDLRSVSIFELSDEQLRERLRPAYEAMTQKAFANDSYITYYDPAVCPTNLHMVHEYRDRKELVRLDENGKALFLRNI
ncbi:MAG TPA: hypothetical protein VGM63_23055 [Mucilaginibacter sp.]|jgi:hypothetical protein